MTTKRIQPVTKKPATLKNIQRSLESTNPLRVSHHIQGSLQITEAKRLGFGTNALMVKLYKGGWVTIDPVTWEIN